MIIQILIAFLPNFISIHIRRLLGAKIGANTQIKFGTVIIANDINIGSNVSIGPFTFIKAKSLHIDDSAFVRYGVILRNEVTHLGKYAGIHPFTAIQGGGKENKFYLGDFSQIFHFCWIETNNGVYIGKRVGVGGYSLIFTHGYWSNYLNGAPHTKGSVHIEDNVWLPWRVFLAPNVTIGKDSIIGANSFVSKNIPENSLAVGNPAEVKKNNVLGNLSASAKITRAKHIIKDFDEFISENHPKYAKYVIHLDNVTLPVSGDIYFCIHSLVEEHIKAEMFSKGISIVDYQREFFYIHPNNREFATLFNSTLNRYGIRLYLHHENIVLE
jgi:acetyltransferase-like isoleucine patch superfamily enzyme